MKIEESNTIISYKENENAPLSGRKSHKRKKIDKKLFPKKYIYVLIFISISIIILFLFFIRILISNKNIKKIKGIQNEDNLLSIYRNKKKKYGGNKLEEIDVNDEDYEEGVNKPLKNRKAGKLFDDDNDENNDVNDEPVMNKNKTEKNKIKETEKSKENENEEKNDENKIPEKNNVNNIQINPNKSRKKDVFDEDDNNEGEEKKKNKNSKVFDEKEEANNAEQEPVLQKKQISKPKKEEEDNEFIKHDKPEDDNKKN